MKRTEPPSQDEFDRLLAWLDPDRERAGTILYEEIRPRLITVLVRRQCHAAEDLWDETFSRVSHRVKDITATYVGNPALYFYGVAKNVYREWLEEVRTIRERVDYRAISPPEPTEDVELIHEYLERCKQKLDPEDRELIVKYHEKEKRAKIDNRKQLADSLGVSLNTLRMRIHRITAILQKCIFECLDPSGATKAGHVLAG